MNKPEQFRNDPRKNKRGGFSIVLVIMVLVLLTAAVVIISGVAEDMIFQTRLGDMDASSRNLAASGLAWSKLNADKLSAAPPNRAINLDVTQLDIPAAQLGIEKIKGTPATSQVKITTRCQRGKINLERSEIFKLSTYNTN